MFCHDDDIRGGTSELETDRINRFHRCNISLFLYYDVQGSGSGNELCNRSEFLYLLDIGCYAESCGISSAFGRSREG